jgi:hypothetical protein
MTDEALWRRVDAYFVDRVGASDAQLESALAANAAAGLPPIDVSPTQGKFLYLLARLAGARNVLEIGSLGGYSTIWLARAVPAGGRVVTLEASPTRSTCASVRRSTGCRGWRRKGPGRSTSFSSTPTNRTIRVISPGLCAWRGRARRSSATTSRAKAR